MRKGLEQRPGTDRHDRAGVLGDGNELGRRDDGAVRLLPAHQRFEADDIARLQIEDRLVEQTELAAVESAVERSFDGEAMGDPLVHRLVVDGQTVAAGILGAIHRRVGMSDKILGCRARRRADGSHADAGGDEDIALAEGKWFAEHSEQALGGSHCGALRLGVGIEHHVFVARQASHDGVGRHCVDEAAGHGDQHLIAGGVAQRVVDVLEAVEVDEEQRGVLVGVPAGAQ
ncbi:unannotated protein [freshwater metagenome]|uniref:Unannotated protein n=1 Tax=freshwater metagenome TaxID=449393 RepID=A0A6J7ASF8_9ZZZZ